MCLVRGGALAAAAAALVPCLTGLTGLTCPIGLAGPTDPLGAGATPCPGGLVAQTVVRVEVGASSFRDAYGSRVEFWHPRLEGWLGMAAGADAPAGGQLRARIRGLDALLGDMVLPLGLPSDVDGGAALPTRGLAVQDTAGAFRWRAAGGRIAHSWSILPGLVTSRSAGAVIAADAGWTPVPGWEALLRHTWTPEGTADVLSLEHTRGGGRIGSSLGLQQGRLYGALSGRLRTETLDLRAGWTGGGGRRVAADEFRFLERAGFSGSLGWRPAERWSLHLARTRRRPSLLPGDTTPVRTLYRGSLAAPLGASRSVRVALHLSPEPQGPGGSGGVSAGVGGRVVGPIRSDLAVFASRDARGREHVQTSLTIREQIRPDLDLLQRLDHAGRGWPSLSVGGRYDRGGNHVGVDYRTEFVPGPSGAQFRTALVLDVRLQLSGTTDLTAGTYLDGNGQARYRVQRGQWFYPGGVDDGAPGVGPRRDAPVDYAFGRYVVRGRVELEDGTPVEGAAVEIGEHLLFTDGRGRFLLRTEDPVRGSLHVRTGQFLLEFRYEVARAPGQVESREEDAAPEHVIVLRRLPPAG